MNKRTPVQPSLPLELTTHDGRVFLNGSVWMEDHDGMRVIFCHHEPLFRIPLGDVVCLRIAAVTLRLSKLARQEEIAEAFGHSVATQRRWETQYQRESVAGLTPKRKPGMQPKVAGTAEALVRRWFAAGATNAELARRLAVDEATIRRTLRRLGLQRVPCGISASLFSLEAELAAEVVPTAAREAVEANPATEPPRTPETTTESHGTALLAIAGTPEVILPASAAEDTPTVAAEVAVSEVVVSEVAASKVAASKVAASEVAASEVILAEAGGADLATVLAAAAAASGTIDRDPHDRSGDRALARVGLLEDAQPLFGNVRALPRAGVLLAIPALVRSGLVETFREVYHTLAPAFYGLRTMVVTLFSYALLRIKRPEQVKEYPPDQLGWLLGLDRSPEVKTIRRQLTHLGERRLAVELQAALARRRLATHPDRLAYLYVDGHVREYYGQYALPSAKKPQRQVAHPAATDTWVQDAYGEPVLEVTHEVNLQLTQVLQPILQDVREWVPQDQRVTVVFDRGGFSPQLFGQLEAAGYDVLTYRKGRTRPLPLSRFTVQRAWLDGAWREYAVYDRPRVRVGKCPKESREGEGRKYFWMREVRVLREDGRQTSILTHRRDLSAVEVAYRMFFRWRQENFFKYMKAEFALDALVEYGAEPVLPERDRPNPQRKALDQRLQQARAEVRRLQAELGAELSSPATAAQRTVRGFKIAHAELRGQLAKAEAKVRQLETQRSAVPARVSAGNLQHLKTEKKLIVDAIKIAAYQAETELLSLLQEHYARTADEGRTLLQAAFQSAADLEVREGELWVTLAAQSSPHRTAALAALCRQLDASPTLFPGTSLRLRFAVTPHKTAHLPEAPCPEF